MSRAKYIAICAARDAQCRYRARRARTAEDGKVAKKKISRNVEKSSRMRTGGAGCTCAQGPDRGRWKSCEKKKFHEMSKNTRACALAAPGVRARRARTAEDGKVAKKKISRNVEKSSRMRTGGAGCTCAQGPDRGRWKSCEKKKFHEMSKNSRACALTVPGVRARRARTRGRWKSCEKKKFHEMSKNSRACALAVPGVRARRTRTAEDGIVAKKKNFPKCRKIFAHAHWRCRVYVRAGPRTAEDGKVAKKKIPEMSKNLRACALAVPGVRARRARTAEDGKVAKKKNFPKCRKIFAHAHWRCRVYVRAGPGPRKMEKLRKKKISRNVEKFSRMRTDGAGGYVRAGPGPRKMEKLRKKKFHEMSKNTRACALAVPGVRARRARTAEDGKVAKKKNFTKCRKILAHAHWWCRGDVRAGPGPRKMEKLRKKKFLEMSKNTRACALAVPGVRARRARTAEDGKVAKKKNFTKCRKILAHAHWRCRGDVRAGPGPRKME